MPQRELIDYIKSSLNAGRSREEIYSLLLSSGWPDQTIQEAFSSFSDNPAEGLVSPLKLLSEALKIYKKRFFVFLGVMALPVISQIFVLVLLTGGYFLVVSSSLLAKVRASPLIYLPSNPYFLLIIIALVIVFLLAFLIINAWGQLALLYAVKESEQRIGIINSYRKAWSKITSFIWLRLLSGFLIIGGYFLFLIPGIIFSVWFSLAFFILVTEDSKGMEALLKSREYVRGHFLGVLWRFLILSILSLIILFLLFLVSSLLFGSAQFTGRAGKSSLESLSFLLTIFLSPIATTYLYLLYQNLKTLKGGFVFNPTLKQKISFISVSLAGFLLLVFFVSTIYQRLFIPIANIYKTTSSPSHSAERSKYTRDEVRRKDLVSIQTSLFQYYNDNGSYPVSLEELAPNYLSRSYTDPLAKAPYEYSSLQNGQQYSICARFELTGYGCEGNFPQKTIY